MRAVLIEEFGQQPSVVDLPDPEPAPDGVVVRVEATGVCASDRFAWAGHDRGVVLPHVPGHELAGRVVAVGSGVRRVRPGDRVLTPFVCGCGRCDACRDGRSQVCPHQEQPGFTHAGSFAELVALRHADVNLVAIDEDADAAGSALLGCRVATAHRAVVDRAGVRAGDRVLVVGAGGVGLAAVLVATLSGAEVVVADPSPEARARAEELGAVATVDPTPGPAAVREVVGRPRVAIEAVGRADALAFAVRAVRDQGVVVAVGLVAEDPALPVAEIVGRELALLGSHGMSVSDYPRLMELVASGRLDPTRLVTRRIGLDDAPAALAGPAVPGEVVVIEP